MTNTHQELSSEKLQQFLDENNLNIFRRGEDDSQESFDFSLIPEDSFQRTLLTMMTVAERVCGLGEDGEAVDSGASSFLMEKEGSENTFVCVDWIITNALIA
jgi:hypothetical protein